MPRSNKKKGFLAPQPEHPTSQSSEISSLLEDEKNKMISRAINSGRNHGIDLVAGRPNPGLGDCAFEAILQNNNNKRNSFCQSITTEAYGLPIWPTEQLMVHGIPIPTMIGWKDGNKCKYQELMREEFSAI